MAFDACMMRAVLSEFKNEFPEGKIEKVFQPRNDEIDLQLRHGGLTRRLVFNVGPNAPRLQLSDLQKENPLSAPMFCMLLRKHLQGARIVSAEQPGFDRIAVFTVKAYDDMGFPTEKKIVCEIMGKYANLIILGEDDKIITALKIIDFSSSTVRQVLPGLKYQTPAQQDKLMPLSAGREDFFARLSDFSPERTGEKFITENYLGIATQIAHELVYRASGAIDTPVCDIDPERFYSVFSDWQSLLTEERYTPTVAFNKAGEPIDYSYMDITYREGSATTVHYASLRELFDAYFADKDRRERIKQRAHDLVTLLSNTIARTERKLSLQREALAESRRGEEYKLHADLITANIYRLKRGMQSFTAVDYTAEEPSEVEIELNPRLTPAENAQRLYKLYNKCKTARQVLAEQIEKWEAELVYLQGVEGFLGRAESEEDLIEIRDELYRSGYASRLRGYRPPKTIKARPMRFTTSGGFTLLVGRNNVQNDYLTFKLAERDDIWFHTKDIPGSHCILVTEGKEPGDIDYTEAASVAAYYSRASAAPVAVDYTRVKNIKKPQGAKPGFVIYKTNYTAYVSRLSGEEIGKNG
ncbi:MAG: NFACT family protein [Clostridia bacterium]|nr:NFACT family protein [Clostridia bacterium]